MAEYTYEDIIMDPNDPRLEGAIGKECYVSDFPKIALNNARDNLIPDRLKRIAKEETCPFVDEEEDNWYSGFSMPSTADLIEGLMGLYYKGKVKAYRFVFNGNREKVRNKAAVTALDLVRRAIIKDKIE